MGKGACPESHQSLHAPAVSDSLLGQGRQRYALQKYTRDPFIPPSTSFCPRENTGWRESWTQFDILIQDWLEFSQNSLWFLVCILSCALSDRHECNEMLTYVVHFKHFCFCGCFCSPSIYAQWHCPDFSVCPLKSSPTAQLSVWVTLP